MRKKQKLGLMLASIFLLAAFFLVFFHYHTDGQHQLDCPVCRLVQQIVSVFILLSTALTGHSLEPRKLISGPFHKLRSSLLSSLLPTRAPPLLS